MADITSTSVHTTATVPASCMNTFYSIYKSATMLSQGAKDLSHSNKP